METKMVKTAKYGFLSGLGLSILFVPYKTTIRFVQGGTETTYVNLHDYFISLLRYSVLITILALVIVLVVELNGRKKAKIREVLSLIKSKF